MNSPTQYARPTQGDPDPPSDPERVHRLRRLVSLPAARRGHWLVLIFWIGLLVVAGPFAGKVSDVENNEATSFLPRVAQATHVADLLPRFHQDEVYPAEIVYSRDGGLTAADRAAITAAHTGLVREADGPVQGPTASDDGAALRYSVPLVKDPVASVETLRDQVGRSLPDGLSVHVTGPAGTLHDQVEVFHDLDSQLLLATVGVVAFLLLLTYRSPTLWLLPLIAVGFGSQLATAVVYLLGRHAGLPVDGQSGGLLTVIVFGVGTDYALLLISRYREELHRNENRYTAMRVALRRAAPAIAASAGTVVAGLLCLMAADLNSTRSLGGVGAIAVACAGLTALTLLPALLVTFGRWVFWPLVPRAGAEPRRRTFGWHLVAAAIGRRPRVLWASSLLVLAALLLGLSSLHLGITEEQRYWQKPDSVRGQEVVAAHYAAGAAAPTQVVAASSSRAAVERALRGTPGVAQVGQTRTSDDGALVLVPVVLADAPDSDAADRTIERMRTRLASLSGADAAVGGPTAAQLDTRNAAHRDQWVVIPLALVAIALILVLVLRSLLVSFVLIATVVASYLAALGATVLVLDVVFGVTAIDFSLPLLGFLLLVALGVDYNIFLMTRVREEVARSGHREGVLRGLTATGGVITSAGIVLAATFAVFIGMPLTSLASMGLFIAIGVLLDTLLVRTVLVPALALDIGPAIWWPSRLLTGATRR